MPETERLVTKNQVKEHLTILIKLSYYYKVVSKMHYDYQKVLFIENPMIGRGDHGLGQWSWSSTWRYF